MNNTEKLEKICMECAHYKLLTDRDDNMESRLTDNGLEFLFGSGECGMWLVAVDCSKGCPFELERMLAKDRIEQCRDVCRKCKYYERLGEQKNEGAYHHEWVEGRGMMFVNELSGINTLASECVDCPYEERRKEAEQRES